MSAELDVDLALETAQRMLASQPRSQALRHARQQEALQSGSLRGDNQRAEFWRRVAEYIEEIPSTPRQHLNAFGIDEPRICSGCFKTISVAEWETLESLGAQVFPPYENDPGEVLDMRNHYCGSTLTSLEPYTAREFERNVDVERQAHPGWSLKQLRREVFNNMHRDNAYYRKRGFGAAPTVSITCAIGQHQHCQVPCTCSCHRG